MSKRFLKIYRFLEKMMFVEFGVVFVLALLSTICTTCVITKGITWILGGVLLLLMANTGVCFAMATIWMIQFMSAQVEKFMKYYEEILRANGFGHNNTL